LFDLEEELEDPDLLCFNDPNTTDRPVDYPPTMLLNTNRNHG